MMKTKGDVQREAQQGKHDSLPMFSAALEMCGPEIKNHPLIGWLISDEINSQEDVARRAGCTPKQIQSRVTDAKIEYTQFVTHQLFGGTQPHYNSDAEGAKEYSRLYNKVAAKFK